MNYFKPEEFACKCGCGDMDMDPVFLSKIDALRGRCGFPLIITSGKRCEAHNRAVDGGVAHPTGKAADVAVSGSRAHVLTSEAIKLGFTGIGWKQHGPKRFVHLDILPDGDAPRPWVWSYR